ncbi:kinase suppressor of Ras 1-like isoform X2 [Rhincodon typus]|uniref:kinase suppressor of Ras 1-like isoform X2 n=1 Tax=Rhincodon typus TaxID=259920 RepID=UPI00202FD900|nr:kinase suppressor of Ras 1-like isoform X2 [Rhincodon typus]
MAEENSKGHSNKIKKAAVAEEEGSEEEEEEEEDEEEEEGELSLEKALQQCDLNQDMIDISISSLEGLRTKCSASNDLTQQEIRMLEGMSLGRVPHSQHRSEVVWEECQKSDTGQEKAADWSQ